MTSARPASFPNLLPGTEKLRPANEGPASSQEQVEPLHEKSKRHVCDGRAYPSQKSALARRVVRKIPNHRKPPSGYLGLLVQRESIRGTGRVKLCAAFYQVAASGRHQALVIPSA